MQQSTQSPKLATAIAAAFALIFAIPSFAASDGDAQVTYYNIVYTIVNNTTTPLPDDLPPGTSDRIQAGHLSVSCDGRAFGGWDKGATRTHTCGANTGETHTLTYSWPFGLAEEYHPLTVPFACQRGQGATVTFTGSGSGITASQTCTGTATADSSSGDGGSGDGSSDGSGSGSGGGSG